MKTKDGQTRPYFFQKGNVPWNKGKHIRPHPNSLNNLYRKKQEKIGTVRTWKRRYGPAKDQCHMVRFIKVRPYRRGGPKAWIRLSRFLWEKCRGPVPKGWGVVHLNGNRIDDSLSNLGLMKKGEYTRYLKRLSPKFAARVDARISRNRKRISPHKTIRLIQCTGCAFDVDGIVKKCPKCGSESFEELKIRVA